MTIQAATLREGKHGTPHQRSWHSQGCTHDPLTPAMNDPAHYEQSSLRESLVEHLFIGELLKHLWLEGPVPTEVLKPQVDAAGYDVVIECFGVLRHIQLKASARRARTAVQKIHTTLAGKPSGCVVWIQFDAGSLELGPYLYFGGPAGHPLPDLSDLRTAKHTKANAQGIKSERPNIRVVPKGRFEVIHSMEELVAMLFGRKVEPSG